MKVFKKNRGISLIETILYAAIISIVSVFVIGSVLVMMRTFNNIQLARNINISARISMERMIREIRLADSIDGTSVFDFNPGRLKLNTIDSGDNPATVEFFLDGSNLMIKEGSGQPENLTGSGVKTSSLIFRQISASTTSKAVRIELEIWDSLPQGYQKTEKFYDTAILRRSYK